MTKDTGGHQQPENGGWNKLYWLKWDQDQQLWCWFTKQGWSQATGNSWVWNLCFLGVHSSGCSFYSTFAGKDHHNVKMMGSSLPGRGRSAKPARPSQRCPPHVTMLAQTGRVSPLFRGKSRLEDQQSCWPDVQKRSPSPKQTGFRTRSPAPGHRFVPAWWQYPGREEGMRVWLILSCRP